jgi:hypothetical protein
MIEKRRRVTPFKNEEPWDLITPQKRHHCDNDHCPECGEEYQRPKPNKCICRKPLMICIPPGQHIHIHCPVHGDVKIYGPRLTYMNDPQFLSLSVFDRL